ncbi:hypothetical protein BDN67DRAFT_150750 [Paxillus ammoniavirescens]|nr:hypothetical protein BDN67DRAFT_150750 [Paxillus ammoniavirescens]
MYGRPQSWSRLIFLFCFPCALDSSYSGWILRLVALRLPSQYDTQWLAFHSTTGHHHVQLRYIRYHTHAVLSRSPL